MVDDYLKAGFTYFDTSYVYHNGKSQEAVRKSLVERHPRNSYTIATKFPTFFLKPEEEFESIFQSQLDSLGVDYIDYYLIHNIQTYEYDSIDGKEGYVASSHIFDHAKKWKEQGKIKHLGFSFHSSAKLLDRVLTDHPEVEFVQIIINYYDWEGEFVQSRKCYETIRKHGKKVVIMEPVRGGFLAKAPPEAEALLKARNPNGSIASWALRFTMDLEGVIAVLSGMSTPDQVHDNINTFKNPKPLTAEDKEVLKKVISIYKKTGPYKTDDFSKYAKIRYHGVPVSSILDAFNSAQIQPVPGFAADDIYIRNTMLEEGHFDCKNGIPKQKVVLEDGTDITEMVESAAKWLADHFIG